MGIDFAKAREIALLELAGLEAEVGRSLSLKSDSTKETSGGWIFFYNTTDYLRDGDILAALAGNGPLHVSNDGKLTHIPSSISWEEWVRSFD